jgi:hypothetical protein
MRLRPSYANVMATGAVFIALSGTGVAADGFTAAKRLITGADVKNESLTGKDVKNSSLGSSDIKDRSLRAKDFKAGELPAGATGPAGPTGTVDTTNFYDKATSDGRFIEVRTVDVSIPVGSNRPFDVGAAHLVAQCSGGPVFNLAATAGEPVVASAGWIESTYGGGGSAPLAGRQTLGAGSQNLVNASTGKQVDGTYVFRTPGKVVTLAFHGVAHASIGCELHATISEPRT